MRWGFACLLSLLISAQQVRANTLIDEPVEAATARGQTEFGQTFIAPSTDVFLATFEFYKTALGQGTQGTFDCSIAVTRTTSERDFRQPLSSKKFPEFSRRRFTASGNWGKLAPSLIQHAGFCPPPNPKSVVASL